jgi:hypothetical protein
MKRKVVPQSENQIRHRFPLDDLLPGWYFRVLEVSASHYEAEGTDPWGRTVYRSGGDGDDVLRRCVEDARAIQRQLSGSS